jgi:hypothetical protein
MGVLDAFKKREERHREERLEEAGNGGKEQRDRPALSDDERKRVIQEAREELPDLDRKVEENVERLRDLSRSS